MENNKNIFDLSNEQIEQIKEEEEQILLTNGIYSMQNHKNKSI